MFSQSQTVIMQMSGMYEEEGFRIPGARVLDFKTLGGTQCLCDDDALRQLREQLAPLPPCGIHWIDGGDWHYLSLLWLEKIKKPFTLYLLDKHTDDQPASFGPDVLSCGSWVLEARRLPMLSDVNWTGGDGSVRSLTGEGANAAYISIDLDVLSREYAVTNWDQGTMGLGELMDAISKIAAHHTIIGIDICGGILPSQGACSCDLAQNKETRKKLQDYLLYL